MQPGDGQQVRQTGITKCLLHLFRDRAAFSGHRRRSDATGGAGKTAAIRRVTSVRFAGEPRANRLLSSGNSGPVPDGPRQGVPDRADPGEVEFALEVAAAGTTCAGTG